MIYRFEEFELDRARVELRRGGEPVAVERQVFGLLLLLVENAERLVSRDEIVEKVWDGRVVSDSAIASRVKSARRALGDDGRAQKLIRTIHGQGFRFVAEVSQAARVAIASQGPAPERPDRAQDATGTRPSIAVLPFRRIGDDPGFAAIDDALPDELIAEFARLRWLFVIARGSSFRFRSATPDPAEVGQVLGARYCLSGSVEIAGSLLAVTIQLVDTANAGVVWADRFQSNVAGVHEMRARIRSRVVAALEIEIPRNEAREAALSSPESLDAWAAYHLGRQHMFRFNRRDNAAAAGLFGRAVEIDPGFARAHAGLSFVHFQNAFLRYADAGPLEVADARRSAERAVELDALDPFANFAMGRIYWLDGRLDAGLAWLERAVAISPNYAQGIYARAWTHALSGRGHESQQDADLAMALSPLDPLHYAMAGTRALSHTVRGEDSEAARWAETAASSPGAHVMIAMIALAAHALDRNHERAAGWADEIRRRNPVIGSGDFFRSFPFSDDATRQRLRTALESYKF